MVDLKFREEEATSFKSIANKAIKILRSHTHKYLSHTNTSRTQICSLDTNKDDDARLFEDETCRVIGSPRGWRQSKTPLDMNGDAF